MGIIGVRKRLDHLLRWFQLFFSRHLPVFLQAQNKCSNMLNQSHSTAFHCIPLHSTASPWTSLGGDRSLTKHIVSLSFLKHSFLQQSFPYNLLDPSDSPSDRFWNLLVQVVLELVWREIITLAYTRYPQAYVLPPKKYLLRCASLSCVMLEVCKLCGSFVAPSRSQTEPCCHSFLAKKTSFWG